MWITKYVSLQLSNLGVSPHLSSGGRGQGGERGAGTGQQLPLHNLD